MHVIWWWYILYVEIYFQTVPILKESFSLHIKTERSQQASQHAEKQASWQDFRGLIKRSDAEGAPARTGLFGSCWWNPKCFSQRWLLSFYLEGKVMTDKDQKQVFALSSESTHTIGMKPDHNLHHPWCTKCVHMIKKNLGIRYLL